MSVFGYFVRAYPWQSFVVLLCLLLAAVTEGIGISTLLPLLSIATRSNSGADGDSAPSEYETWVRDALVTMEAEYGSDSVAAAKARFREADERVYRTLLAEHADRVTDLFAARGAEVTA